MSTSWLFPLPVEGEGTAQVEAMSSYVLRLASAHTVASGTLIGLILDRFPCVGSAPGRTAFKVPCESLIRPNATTLALTHAVAAATGRVPETLECLTFLATIDALSRPQGAFSPELRWCPCCFGELLAQDRPIYFQLRWQVRFVQNCDIHGVRLRSSCQSCGACQGGASFRESLGVCVKCEHPLHSELRQEELAPHQFDEITDLVKHIAARPGFRFPKAGVARVVAELLESAWRDEREMELFRTLSRDECIRFARPEEPVTLQSALRIAFRLHLPLVSLLNGDISGTSRWLLPPQKEGLPDNLAHGCYKTRAIPQDMGSRISLVLERSRTEGPLSLRALSREVGISVGGICYRFPTVARKVVELAKASHAKIQRRIDTEIKKRVGERFLRMSKELGSFPSRKLLLQTLFRESGLPKHRLRREINRCVEKAMLTTTRPPQ